MRTIIEEQTETNDLFREKSLALLEHFKKAINPNIQVADIREMIIQHILTEDIFMRIFDDAEFHRENNIAVKLSEISNTFYTGTTKRNIDNRISYYYETINAKASQISDHHEKQKFLKALYENFYRAYNPKAADRLGVIYTPEEIVGFMIESTDHLLFKHFNKSLGEPNVEILDPATGTGTFITELIEYLPSNQLESKYEHEIHCNEVSILPYYIANLNIEYTYKQKTGKYKEFENICLVDTLDNLGFSKNYDNQPGFSWLSDENTERIEKQNSKKISVIIGNPPYNANQLNENENNKNREYLSIDKRIKETYIKQSTAQKTKLYDMYARFLRWSSDRISENGIIAFVSNNSFIDARSFDGFRKVVADEFSDIYIINLKGDARTSGERRRKEGGNIFSDQIRVGIAVYFLIKKKSKTGCQIHYNEIDDYLPAEEKKDYLLERKIKDLPFVPIHPDSRNNWLSKSIKNWDKLLPVASKSNLSSKFASQQTVFNQYSLGVSTNRDEWVFDINGDLLLDKVNYFIDSYNSQIKELKGHSIDEISKKSDYSIKWSSTLKSHVSRGDRISLSSNYIVDFHYRPFIKVKYYSEKILSDRLTSNHYQLYGFNLQQNNSVITFSGTSSNKPFSVLATNLIFSLDLIEKTQCLPLYTYDGEGKQIENITDYCLKLFNEYYKSDHISKVDIFNYVYGVLNHHSYKQQYSMNLKTDFPHIPLYDDFWIWSEWGKTLMDLHINFEQVSPYPLQREEIDPETNRKAIVPRLLARKDTGKIEIDTLTTLTGVPNEVWGYRLGTYSAVEWVLERYKEKTPKDPTIREKFNTYKFADYKEHVIDLISRVCTVSIETMKIVKEMESTGEA